MSNPNYRINIAEGDMPWGIFMERERMDKVSWYEPEGDGLDRGRKRIIERFALTNGVHYALILDAQTGQRVLSSRERDGDVLSEPRVLRGTDLGNGHRLQMFVTHRADEVQSGKDACTSFVTKFNGRKLSGREEPERYEHELHYDVDPICRTLRLGYEYQSALQYSKVILRPFIEPNWGDGHEVVLGVAAHSGENNGFLSLTFDQKGKICFIYGLGKRNILSSGVVAPGISFTVEEARQSSSYFGDKLSSPEIHSALSMIFGIEYEDPLTLNIGVSTNNMFANIDSQRPKDPRYQLVFKNSSPLIRKPLEIPSFV